MLNRQAKWLIMPVVIIAAMMVAVFVVRSRARFQPARPHSMEHVRQLVWLNNWSGAADELDEFAISKPSDQATALFTRLVHLRGRIESHSLPAAAAEIRSMLEDPVVRDRPELQMQMLSALGDIEFQYNLRGSHEAWSRARKIADEVGSGPWKARCDGELGTIAFLNGDIRTAVGLIAAAAARAEYYSDYATQIRLFTALGEGSSKFGRNADALRFFDKALNLYRSVPGAYFPFTAYLGKAKLLAASGRSGEARQMLTEGLAGANTKGFRVRQARLLATLAEIAEAKGDLDEAYDSLSKAADLASQAGIHRIESDVTGSLAAVELKRGDRDGAARFALRSVQAAERAGDNYSLPQKLAVLAEAEADRGAFAAAEQAYTKAAVLVDSLLQTVPYAKDKGTLVGAMERVFRGHFELALDRLRNPARAFEILESARSRGVLEVIQRHRTRDSKAALGSPMDAARLAALHTRLATESNPSRRDLLLKRLWETEVRSFRPATADHGLRPTVRTLKLRDVQKSLRPDEVFVQYVLGSPRSFALAITNKAAAGYRLANRTEIETLADRYRAALFEMNEDRGAASELYRRLIVPVVLAAGKRRMVIVPDGSLHTVPFDALIDDSGAYVLTTKVVSYAPSATVNTLLASAKGKTPGTVQGFSVLAVGGVRYGVNSRTEGARAVLRSGSLFEASAAPSLPALPSAAREIAELGILAGGQATTLSGAGATESAVREALSRRYGVVHFAVHTAIDEDFPDRSALILSRDPQGESDALLQAREVLALNFDADLVTLSACDAGSGKLEGIAGMNSLVQAFVMAGARSVVASTWAAEDKFTEALMRRFYEHLKRGSDKAEALALAKRELIAMYGSNAVPFYWAGFRLVGDPHGIILGD